MGKPRRSQRHKKANTGEDVYDASLSQADVPSSKELSSEYYNDAIDDFHDKKFKSLMDKGVTFDSDDEPFDSEDEVMGIDIPEVDDDDDDDEEEDDDQASMGSDLEERDKDGLPDEMAWGQRKKIFYDTDYKEHSKKKAKKSKEELDAEAQEEEEEAQNIQRRLAKTLNEEDYGLDFLQEFVEKPSDEKPSEEKIVKDLEKMSEKEKRKLLKKESPELLELIQDLKIKLEEVKNELEPLLQLVKDGTIPKGKGSDYLQTKYHLYMNYCTNISYYLILKAKRLPITGHPVIERLVTYRNLINNLAPVDERLAPEIQLLLSGHVPKKPAAPELQNGRPKATKKVARKRPLEEAEDSDMDEEAALNYYKMMESKLLEKRQGKEEAVEELPEEEEEELDPNAKRAITYQIAKNKGLTPKRKKIDRNPRVKHREKFRKAKIRRKGQVREVRKEEVRYSGEISGIRAGVKKSIKIK